MVGANEVMFYLETEIIGSLVAKIQSEETVFL
jgi:hypothetical protein